MSDETYKKLEDALVKVVEYWSDRATNRDSTEALLKSVQAIVTLEAVRR